jgi:hypothetical protein
MFISIVKEHYLFFDGRMPQFGKIASALCQSVIQWRGLTPMNQTVIVGWLPPNLSLRGGEWVS